MDQAIPDVKNASPQKRSLIDIADWLEAEERNVERTRLTEEPAKKKSKTGLNRVEATTIVTGRPTANDLNGTNDLLSFDEPLPPVQVDLGRKNWVGQLLEYRQAHPFHTGPEYQESSPGFNLFTCLVTLGERPEPLGNDKAIFVRKKDAKQYAAKLTVEWLIATKHMPSDGSVSFPKPRPQQPPQQPPKARRNPNPGSGSRPAVPGSSDDDGTITANNGPSYGQRVAEMCTRLAMSPPSYVITRHADFQAMYSGHAYFENNPYVLGRVGEFADVYGKRRAKETCAENVLDFLEGIAAARAGRGVTVPHAESAFLGDRGE